MAAAIEFVSPGNKDRPANRRALAIKCASYLQQGASVLLVDIVTIRSSPIHHEIVALLSSAPGNGPAFGPLYSVAYRTVASKESHVRLDAWPETLELGKSLPEMPLWLASDCVIPVNLENSYARTCATLRIRAG